MKFLTLVFTDKFTSEAFLTFCKIMGILSQNNFNPQSNDMIERAVQTVNNLIVKASHDNIDFYLTLLEYRNTSISNSFPS